MKKVYIYFIGVVLGYRYLMTEPAGDVGELYMFKEILNLLISNTHLLHC